MDSLIFLVALFTGLATLVVLNRKGVTNYSNPPNDAGKIANTAWTRRANEQRLEAQLLTMLRGDKEAMIRLVGYEQKRFPGGDRSQLLQRVIDRWLYDNR